LGILKRLPVKPSWVLTKPPSRSGRKMKLSENVVMDYAHKENIDCFDKASDDLVADLLIVVSYGNMIPKNMLDYKFGSLNLHPSFLPKYRGSAPIQRAIISGEKEIGVSWIKLVKDLDAGPVLFQGSIRFDYKDKNDNYNSAKKRISIVGSSLLTENWENIFSLNLNQKKQCGEVTWADRIAQNERVLDFSKGSKELNSLIKALDPYPGAKCKHGDSWITLKKSSFSEDFNFQPGELRVKGDSLMIGTSKGVLIVGCVVPEGRKVMTGRDFLNSRPNAKFN